LTGTYTLAHYDQVLDSVAFNNTSRNPSNYGSGPTRSAQWTVNDGTASSNIATASETINIVAVNNPPALSNVTAFVAVTQPTVTVSPALLVSDPDNLTLVSATVAITGGTFAGDGDVLAATTIGTSISASYDAATETLALTGSDTLADYQQVLDSVTFS